MNNHKKFLSFLLAATMLAAPLMANAASIPFPDKFYGKDEYKPLGIDGYKLVWTDDFMTLSLDKEKKFGGSGKTLWVGPVHAPLGIGRMAVPPDPLSYSQTADKQNFGTLFLKTHIERTGTQLQKTGWVDTNIQNMDSLGKGFAIVNGYVEVKAQLPTAHGSHAGIWLLSMHDEQKGHSELDVIESYGRSDSVGDHMAIHLWPGKSSLYSVPVATSEYVKVPDLQTKYHKFGILLKPTTITWFVDDRSVATIDRPAYMKDQAFHVLLSNFTDPNRTDGYEPSTMAVSYVHIYVHKSELNTIVNNPY